MIKYLKIKQLYKRFDYTISFGSRSVTILTGPNGYGKTTILKIINYIYNNDFKEIIKIDFNEIEFESIDGKKLKIEKVDDTLKINDIKLNRKELSVLYSIFDFRKENKKDDKHHNNRIFEKNYNYIINRNKNYEEYLLENYSNSLSKYEKRLIESAVCEFGDMLESDIIEKRKNNLEIILENLEIVKKHLGDVYFIREQRLLKEEYEEYILGLNHEDSMDVINSLPDKFKKIIDKTSNEYSAQSNKLDSTYPMRLFEMEKGITEKEYKQKIQEIGEKFEKLKKYDISDMQNINKIFCFKEEHSKALKVYFDDFDIKYKVYEGLIKQLDLFVGIINDRLQFKKIKINRENGIKVIDDEGRDIELEYLSSGEKQEIVLFFELIFASKRNALILIDEPEISLHIAWQKRFMKDVISIADEMDFKVIVATHSPQIIGPYRDDQIDLGELYARNK